MSCSASRIAATAQDAPRKLSKRTDYIDWDLYFMSLAFLSAQRSKDPSTQVGACIVGLDNKIVGIGYNGFPRGCSDDVLPWTKHEADYLDNKYAYVCHAEMNAILNAVTGCTGCRMYVALYPCNECAKLIIQSGIREVVFLSDKHHHKSEFAASRRLLGLAGVKTRQFHPPQQKVTIDFSAIG